jgi:hypothetical protein
MNVKREPYLRGLDSLSQYHGIPGVISIQRLQAVSQSLGGDLKDRQGLMAMGDLTKMQCLGLAQ